MCILSSISTDSFDLLCLLLYLSNTSIVQCYCGEIRQILRFNINLYCPKAYHRSDHSIRIVKYYRDKIVFLNPTSSPGLEPRTGFGFVTFCSCILPTETNNFVLRSVFLSHLVTELQKTPSRGLEHRTDFLGNRLGHAISSF
jgi:hypothetical protein